MINRFRTSIADVGSPVKMRAPFLHKIGTCLITCGTGSALNVTEDNLGTDVCFSAMVSFFSEVVSIVKSILMVPVTKSMKLNLLRDGSRILTKETSDVLERCSCIERTFDVFAVIKSKVLLVVAHRASFYCCQKAVMSITRKYERINSTYVEVNSTT